ncbi:MAG: adenylate/guanylate cyclase domain-containing protein, partial [Chrysiogenetes bacterium]|nr:adenylate/guanylate cyclase domain-containing protein [Chrysiogenetes bacterium]
RSMVHRIAALNKSGTLPGAIQVGIGVGIQAGSAILGNVGSEFRKEFTALGAPVNVSARLQALAGPGEVVVHASFAKDLGDVARFESIGKHELKGFAEPVEVFRLID